jgi:hypothetical protein
MTAFLLTLTWAQKRNFKVLYFQLFWDTATLTWAQRYADLGTKTVDFYADLGTKRAWKESHRGCFQDPTYNNTYNFYI